MDLYKARLITALIAFGIITGACLAAVIYYLVPVLAIGWGVFAAVVVYFTVVESLLVSWVESGAKKQDGKQLVRIHMLGKVAKILLSLFIVLLYYIIVRDGIKEFAIVYIIFYLLFLFAESLMFVKIEKHYNIKR